MSASLSAPSRLSRSISAALAGLVLAASVVSVPSAAQAGTAPTPPPMPDDIGVLPPDPTVEGAALQVTEMLPDSTNVGGSDGYEFIELFNASSEPIGFDDYQLTYLYPQDVETNTNEAAWPAVPGDVAIPAGETLVLWVKNGANDSLTDADFNAHFDSDLTLGDDLVEIHAAGMANGSPRGIDVRTNTGFSLNRAYYNMTEVDDTARDQGIRFGGGDDQGLQTLIDTRPASPGRIQVDQVPDGLVVPPTDTEAPVVDDRIAAEIDPAQGLTIDLGITDDVQVRTVEVTLANDVDDGESTANVAHAGEDAYRHTVAAADVMGKSWYEYTVRATDGANEVLVETRRVPVAGAGTEPLRLNVADGDFLGATSTISAAVDDYPPQIDLAIDGSAVATRPSLESEPMFVFETSQTDFSFRNGVRIGDDILHIFDEGTYAETETIAVPVSLEYVEKGTDLTVSIWAGTKAWPWIDDVENNDDFVVSGMRLVLPDGRTLRPAGYEDPDEMISMGDSAGNHDFFDATFALGDDAFTALAHDWDTTVVADGGHTVSATSGPHTAASGVVVDNTAPDVASSLEQGAVYQGEIVLDAEISDAGSGVDDVVATLDGERVELGATTSSALLVAGEHTFSVMASDALGNATTRDVTFTVPEEQPGSTGFAPAHGSEQERGDVILQAEVEDPTGDALDVTFLEGARVELGDEELTARSGAARDASALVRTGASPAVVADQGLAPVVSDDALPYYLFDVDVTGETGDARLSWSGSADRGSQVILSARTADGSAWTEVARHLTTTDDEPFDLTGSVDIAGHASDGVITVLVQHSEGWAGADLSTRDTPVDPAHPDDTPRSDYDFTLAWESDTQYYNEEFTEHQVAIHDFLLEQREAMNIQYLFHTGDVVDDYDQQYQWDNANPQYQRLDEAGLPYGVLAGNHDVGHGVTDYANFSANFGEARYAGSPWYGGSFQDNRGHYDLFTAGGIDVIAVYMGWDPQPEAIAWMNEVLEAHPERVGIIALHEFMLTTGGLGPVPQQIMDEVVAANPNVRMVFSGHYHDAFTRADEFDDDGDGVADRTVHSMLFDYQALPEGGQGFLRLLQFDGEGQKMRVRTYSPSLERYNSDEESLLAAEGDPYAFQDFELSYAAIGAEPSDKRLATTGFTAEVLSDREIGTQSDVASGSVAAMEWPLEGLGTHGWYVRTADPHGGVDVSRVNEFTLVPETDDVDPGPGLSSVAAACRQRGYADLMGTDGRTFRNAGACVSYVASGGVLFPRG